MILRPYQEQAIASVSTSFRAGHRGVMLVMPTGAGKTVVFSRIAKGIADAGGVTLILLPRIELVEQTSLKLAAFGVRHGIIAASMDRPDQAASVQVAMVQTLLRRPHALVRHPSLIICDEAHLSAADSHRAVIGRHPEAKRLGATATPFRLDGQGFLHLATDLVAACTVDDLVDLWRGDHSQGLVPAMTYSVPVIDTDALHRTRNGEFDQQEQASEYVQGKLVGNVVEHYLQHARDRRGIIFAASKPHAELLAAALVACGIRAACVFGDTLIDIRRERLKQLASGVIQVIANFGVLTEGFDCPPVSCISIVRATASKALWIQMAGRGLRPSPGKHDCIILDHGGNALRHGGITYQHKYSLEGRDKKEREPASCKVCKKCNAVMPLEVSACTVCGNPFGVEREDMPEPTGELVQVANDIAPLAAVAVPSQVLTWQERRALAIKNADSWTKKFSRVS